MLRSCVSVALALVGCLLAAGPGIAVESWQVDTGHTTFSFNENLMSGLGLTLEVEQPSALPPVNPFLDVPNWSFEIVDSSDLRFQVNHGVALPNGIQSGSIRHAGTLTVNDEVSGKSFRIEDARLEFISENHYTPSRGVDANPLYMRSTDGLVVFDVIGSMFHLAENDNLDIFYLNIRLSDAAAEAMGRPELAGLVIGFGELRAAIDHLEGLSEGSPYVPHFGDFVDVKLGFLDSCQQAGRVGSTVGLSMATTSCNVGTVDVPWLRPMDEDHPLIHMAMYRQLDGKFEQIGVSWLKHGFFALSNSQCTPCQNPSNGTFLGVGCSDTYGAGNNSDRSYLGPRNEVDPFAGTWECSNSHFQGGAADCVRGHDRNSPHSATDHRLLVEDAELDNAGAQYFYEAYYVVRDDISRDNNWGSKGVTMQLSGNTWFFFDNGSLVEGPAIGRWGDLRTDVPVPADGKNVLAVETTDLGGGNFHYEYALLNYDSDREIRTFSLPVAGVANITNIGFHDSDENAGNDWQVTIENGVITWSTDTFDTDPDANALTFGEMFNFRFDAEATPTDLDATLGLFMPPAGETVTAATQGPTNATTAVAEAPSPQSATLRLTNQPNPVSPRTTIFFDLSQRAPVKLAVYDASGRMVRSLVDYTMLPGSHEVAWDGNGNSALPVAAGVYYARLSVDGDVRVRPMVVVR